MTSPAVAVLYTVIPATCAAKGAKDVVLERVSLGSSIPLVVLSISRTELALMVVGLSPTLTCAREVSPNNRHTARSVSCFKKLFFVIVKNLAI